MKKLSVINLLSALISAFSIYNIIKIDNLSRLPENIYTDFHMASLPYLYLIMTSISISIIVSILQIKQTSK